MTSTFRTEANLLDKLLLVPHISRVLAAAVLRIFTIPFEQQRPKSVFKEVVYAALRTNLHNLNVAQEQWMIRTDTQDSYLDVARSQGFQPETTVLSSGLRLHWLGPKTSEKVVLYFHGGGYAMSAAAGQVQWLFQLQQVLAKKSAVSIIIVQYGMTPKTQFPGQLQEAAEALYWLVEKQERRPSDIALAGDSAGGNLTLALLSHLLHPHEKAQKIELKEPLATAILISPWVSFSSEWDSFKRNARRDMFTAQALDRWSSMFIGSNATNEYVEPIKADGKWWSALDKIVKDVLVWGGKDELLIDSIEHFSKNMQTVYPKTELVIQARAAHDDPVLEAVLEFKEKHEATTLFESWLAERL